MEVKSSGYRDFVWAVNLHRLGFEIMGLWPKPDKCSEKSLWPKIRVGIIVILLIFVSNIPMICAVKRVWGDMVLVIDNLQTTLPLLIVSMKYIILQRKQRDVLSIVNMMAEDWIAFKLNKERNVMIKRARTARFIVIIGYVFALIGFFTITIAPYFDIQATYVGNSTDRRKLLPIETYHFYDTNKSPQFELTYLVQVITLSLAGVIYTLIDAFLGLVIFHICGQLENFRYRLINLPSCKNFNKVLNNIISTHLRLIR
ncbi:PREDICTED: uncharacterized protein LOC105460031 [Wasmannia auropunctata]|uniref:uncharacterized protein LOC105460031 n=1 Tax=Wasmannia auropunctata TaxID=64793 RepID=UPI0005ED81FE|nr:PREDICTED: uncharacterized protein LOC105460031 [Wasmannia auropunctata]